MTSALQGRRVRDPLQTTMVTQLSQASMNKNENKQISLTKNWWTNIVGFQLPTIMVFWALGPGLRNIKKKPRQLRKGKTMT